MPGVRPAQPARAPAGAGRVLVLEVRWQEISPRRDPEPPPPARMGAPYMPPSARQRGPDSPITLSAEAAQQIRLMAHRAGVPGAGVRLIASGRDLQDTDFAFESLAEPDDVVLSSEGIQLYLDPLSFATLEGVHITWDDLPGLNAFQIARYRPR